MKLLFKYHDTYFHTLFYLHVFPQNLNNIIRNLFSNKSLTIHPTSLFLILHTTLSNNIKNWFLSLPFHLSFNQHLSPHQNHSQPLPKTTKPSLRTQQTSKAHHNSPNKLKNNPTNSYQTTTTTTTTTTTIAL